MFISIVTVLLGNFQLLLLHMIIQEMEKVRKILLTLKVI